MNSFLFTDAKNIRHLLNYLCLMKDRSIIVRKMLDEVLLVIFQFKQSIAIRQKMRYHVMNLYGILFRITLMRFASFIHTYFGHCFLTPPSLKIYHCTVFVPRIHFTTFQWQFCNTLQNTCFLFIIQ